MIRSVYLKTVWEKRFFVLGWTIGFTALAALMTSFFPAMRTDGLTDLVKNFPPAFEGLIGNLALLQDFDTYIASQLFDIRVPLIAGVMAIIIGLNLSVAEEETGELRTITALPIGRLSLLVQKWLAMLTIMIVTTSGFLIGMYAVMPFINDATIAVDDLSRLIAMTLLVIVTYGTIPFAVAFATGRRSAATFAAILVIIGGFILSTFGSAVDWLADYEKFSLLHYFPAVDIIKDNTIQLYDVAVLGTITVALLLVAAVAFRHRDIA